MWRLRRSSASKLPRPREQPVAFPNNPPCTRSRRPAGQRMGMVACGYQIVRSRCRDRAQTTASVRYKDDKAADLLRLIMLAGAPKRRISINENLDLVALHPLRMGPDNHAAGGRQSREPNRWRDPNAGE